MSASGRQGARHGPLRRCSAKRRAARSGGPGREPRAAFARSRSRGSGPTPTSRACSSTRTRSTSSRSRFASAACSSRSCCGRDGDGFMIVAGERRWRAAQRAQLHTIPAIVRDIDESTTAELALIENIQREDLNALEEAEAIEQLIKRHGHTQDDVGQIVHKSRSHVANLLRLLDLPEFVRQSLLQGDISMGHARAVATAPDPEGSDPRNHPPRAFGAPGRRAGAKREKAGPGRRHRPSERSQCRQAVDADLDALERQLGDILGLKVQVAHKGAGRGGDAPLFEPRSARHDLPAP